MVRLGCHLLEYRENKTYIVENFYVHLAWNFTIYKLLHINNWTLPPYFSDLRVYLAVKCPVSS